MVIAIRRPRGPRLKMEHRNLKAPPLRPLITSSDPSPERWSAGAGSGPRRGSTTWVPYNAPVLPLVELAYETVGPAMPAVALRALMGYPLIKHSHSLTAWGRNPAVQARIDY